MTHKFPTGHHPHPHSGCCYWGQTLNSFIHLQLPATTPRGRVGVGPMAPMVWGYLHSMTQLSEGGCGSHYKGPM